MKAKHISLISLMSVLGLTLSFGAPNTATTAEHKQYLEAVGWNMGNQSITASVDQFGLNAEEKNLVLKGIVNGARGEKAPMNFEKDSEKMLSYLQSRVETQMEKQKQEIAQKAEENKRAAKTFFAGLEKNPKVKKTDSGLYYEVLKSGSPIAPTESSSVKIDYIGRLIDGTEFDSSIKRGEPATFPLAQVIPGFREGLKLIGKGGKIKLYIPSELGYGDNELPNIPAGSTLVFDIDMIDILEGKNS